MKFLSRKEELVLLTIWKLSDNAYGVTIREQISKTTEKYWSIGAIYDVLDRLETKGMVSTFISGPVSERGGKAKRYYLITKKGRDMLMEMKKLEESIWSDLPQLLISKK